MRGNRLSSPLISPGRQSDALSPNQPNMLSLSQESLPSPTQARSPSPTQATSPSPTQHRLSASSQSPSPVPQSSALAQHNLVAEEESGQFDLDDIDWGKNCICWCCLRKKINPLDADEDVQSLPSLQIREPVRFQTKSLVPGTEQTHIEITLSCMIHELRSHQVW